jgi:ketosteroid isomerase-like protein
MGQPTPLTAETQALKEMYAAINRNDVPAVIQIFDPRIERIEPADFPMAGTYRGLAAIQEHVEKARATWAEGTCDPDEFIVAGDKIVVFLYVRVRLKHEKEWREGRMADVFTFSSGKAIHWRSFGERQQALEWAGVKA